MTRKDYEVLARFVANMYHADSETVKGRKYVFDLLVEELNASYTNFNKDKFIDGVRNELIKMDD